MDINLDINSESKELKEILFYFNLVNFLYFIIGPYLWLGKKVQLPDFEKMRIL